MSRKYHLKRREFLNQFTSMPAHIIGIVQDTREIANDDVDAWKWGEITLSMSDCYKTVSFSFDLSDESERENSLHKVRMISDVVNAFREALETEAASIAERQAFTPLAMAATTVH